MFSRKRQTACERIREMFSPYIDAQLSAVEREVVDFHVDVCDACRYQLASMEKTAKLLQSMPVVPVPRSFTLAEAPARGIELPFAMPAMNWLRVATAAAVIALVALVAVDLTGAVDKSGEPVVASPTPTVTPDAQTTPPDVSPIPTDDGNDAIPPIQSPQPWGVVGPVDPNADILIDGPINSVPWEAQQEADLEAEKGEGLSPTPPPHSPSWLLPLEIVAGVLVVILGAAYFLVWQRKREFSTTHRG